MARRWVEGLNDGGLPSVKVSHERIEIGNVKGFVVQGPWHGHAGVLQWLDDAFDVVADRRFEVDEAIDGDDGETVLTVQRATGVSAHTGLAFDLQWAAVWTIRDGKVQCVQGYATKAQALSAAGIVEGQ